MKFNAVINADVHASEEDQYPCLKKGKHTGMIALFNGPKSAMILDGQDPSKRCRAHQKPCYFGTKWIEDQWERFDGSITLSNFPQD